MADHSSTTRDRIVKGATAGLIAGIVASFAMDRFQAAATALSSSDSDGDESEPATVTAADTVVKTATGTPLPDADRPLGGQLVHYAVGTGLGIAYGIAAEFRPGITAAGGTAYGAGVAALLDDVAVPAVGLGAAPWKTPAATHLYSLASHLMFGAVAELVRRSTRATLSPA